MVDSNGDEDDRDDNPFLDTFEHESIEAQGMGHFNLSVYDGVDMASSLAFLHDMMPRYVTSECRAPSPWLTNFGGQ